MRIALILVAASCAPSPPTLPPCLGDGTFAPGTWSGPAIDVPMPVTRTSSDGTMRFAIAIEIGGAPLDVMLDTGSSGLRILRGAVPDAAFACGTTTASTYSYHSGLALDGIVARAEIAVAGIATPAPIPVMYVDSVGCTDAQPDCDANGASVDDYTLFGGFRAILGVGMRNGANAIGSVFAQLPGAPTFIVRAPPYGGTSGTLTLGASADDFATFQLPPSTDPVLANGTPAWDDRYGVPACLNTYCEPGEWDTGNPPTYIEWPAATQTTIVPPGTQVAVQIGPLAAPLDAYSFTVAATTTPGIDKIEIEPATSAGFMNLGTALFFHADALFDPARGVVGLRAK